MDPEARIEIALIRDLRLEEQAPTESPGLADQLEGGAVGIPFGIGGIIPSEGVDEAQVQELRARIMRVGIVVENIRRREFSRRHRETVDVDILAELILVGLEIFLAAALATALAEGLAQEQPRHIGLGRIEAGLDRLAVGKAGDAEGSAHAKTLIELGIEIQRAAIPRQALPQESRNAYGLAPLLVAGQAVRSLIGRVKAEIALVDRRALGVQAPILDHGLGFLGARRWGEG